MKKRKILVKFLSNKGCIENQSLKIYLIFFRYYFFQQYFFCSVSLLFCYFLCNIDEKDSSEVLIQQGMYRKQRPPHVVLLKLPAQYGSEAVLKKIYQHSGKAHWKIHVRQRGAIREFWGFELTFLCVEFVRWFHKFFKKLSLYSLRK